MNQKWFINSKGIKVKPCARCKEVFEYDVRYFPQRSTDSLSAYCRWCKILLDREYSSSKRKTSTTRQKNLIYYIGGVPYKKCTKCKIDYIHSRDNFYSCKNGQDGLYSKCKECSRKNGRKINQRNWEYHLYQNAVGSSRRYGLEIDIDVEYIKEQFNKQGGNCYWLGVPLVPSNQIKYLLQPSLDRLDRSKGYVRGNVVVCSFFANFGRNQNSVEDFQTFLYNLKNNINFSIWETHEK